MDLRKFVLWSLQRPQSTKLELKDTDKSCEVLLFLTFVIPRRGVGGSGGLLATALPSLGGNKI